MDSLLLLFVTLLNISSKGLGGFFVSKNTKTSLCELTECLRISTGREYKVLPAVKS